MKDKTQYIEFETAKLAKELNFDQQCDYYYEYSLTDKIDEQDGTSGSFGWKKGEINFQSSFFINYHKDVDLSNNNWYLCGASIQSLLQRWLREVKGINIWIKPFYYDGWNYNIEGYLSNGKAITFDKYDSDTYENALEIGLQRALKYLKNRTNGQNRKIIIKIKNTN